MKLAARFLLLCAVFGVVASAAAAAEVAEGQVVVALDRLFIRTASGEPLAFLPALVQEGDRWLPVRPVRTILPALESGEMVRVTWVWDEREGEGVRRVQAIQILSPLEGVLRGNVVRSNIEELVVRPKDEPGTVTLNNRRVVREGQSVWDPVIAARLRELKPGTRVSIRWAWDNEGRKRITALEPGW